MSANFTPEEEDLTILTPFKMQVLTNFPYIEADFDALTNYQLLCKIVEYLNTVIAETNEVTEQTLSLYNAYVALQNYVNNEITDFESTVNTRVDGLESYMDNYFNNLDVQQEINNKLDAMTVDGTLTELIKNYVDPIYQAYENRINNNIDSINSEIDSINDQITSIASGSPKGVYSTISDLTSADPSHDYIYVVNEDGKWYYYNTSNSSWTAGGDYQASVNLDLVNQLNDLSIRNVNNFFNPLTTKDDTGLTDADGAEASNLNSWVSDFIPITEVTNDNYSTFTYTWNYHIRKICFYDSNYDLVKKVGWSDEQDEYSLTLTDAYVGSVYIRVMVLKENLIYNNRFKFYLGLQPYIPFTEQEKYKLYDTYSIKDNTITVSNLSNGINQGIFLNNILMNKNPLTLNDFVWATISGGVIIPRFWKKLIMTKNAYFIPKGLKILQNNSTYYLMIFEYTEGGAYVGRIGSGTIQSLVIPHSGYYRIIMRKVADAMATQSEAEEMINGLAFENIDFKYYSNNLTYTGEKVNLLENNASYKQTNFTGLFQDGCQYNGTAFYFKNDAEFKVVDLETGTSYTDFHLDQYETIAPHCNSACFSNQKYDESDPFPLLYVNAYNTAGIPKGTCYVHRILKDGNNYSTSLIQTISIGFTDNELWTGDAGTRNYGNFLVDTDNNRLIVYILRNYKTRFFIFNLPSISSSSVTLNTSDIIEYFDCPWFEYIQGGHYQNGKVYSLDGIVSGAPGGTDNSYLHIFDMNTKSLVTSIALTNILSEPESIYEYDNELYIGASSVYKFKF